MSAWSFPNLSFGSKSSNGVSNNVRSSQSKWKMPLMLAAAFWDGAGGPGAVSCAAALCASPRQTAPKSARSAGPTPTENELYIFALT